MHSIIFVESNTSGTGEEFINISMKLGYESILLTNNEKRYSFIDKVKVVKLNSNDKEEVYKFCKNIYEQGNLRGVATSSEYYIDTVAYVANKLKLPSGNYENIKLCRSKHYQREKLRKDGISVPKFYAICSEDEIDEKLVDINLPLIVKPVSGSGSVGVKYCENFKDLKEQAKELLSKEKNERGMTIPKKILVEEFIKGDEFSVECFNGSVIGITKKHLCSIPYFVETGHDFPANIDENKKNIITECAIKTIESLGLSWGCIHIELRVFNNKAYIIEVNPRLAGGFIPNLVYNAFGIDLIENSVKLTLNEKVNITKKVNKYSSIRFIYTDKVGVIEEIDLSKIDENVEFKLYKKVGEKLNNFGDFRDRVGHIICTGDNPDEVIQKVNTNINKINLKLNGDVI